MATKKSRTMKRPASGASGAGKSTAAKGAAGKPIAGNNVPARPVAGKPADSASNSQALGGARLEHLRQLATRQLAALHKQLAKERGSEGAAERARFVEGLESLEAGFQKLFARAPRK